MHLPAERPGRWGGTVAVIHESNEAKAKALKESFFPISNNNERMPEGYQSPQPAFKFKKLTCGQIEKALHRLKPHKAPRPSSIPNVLLKNCAKLLTPQLLPIFNATFELNYHSEKWRLTTTVVLWKPDKTDYSLAKEYRPIALLEMIAKVLASCVASVLQLHTEKEGLLPNTHFGGRPGRNTTDALHMMTAFIKNTWR